MPGWGICEDRRWIERRNEKDDCGRGSQSAGGGQRCELAGRTVPSASNSTNGYNEYKAAPETLHLEKRRKSIQATYRSDWNRPPTPDGCPSKGKRKCFGVLTSLLPRSNWRKLEFQEPVIHGISMFDADSIDTSHLNPGISATSGQGILYMSPSSHKRGNMNPPATSFVMTRLA